MGVKKLVIFLDQPVYYSGQKISGRLVVQLDKPMSMRAIRLKFFGEADVRWSESESDGDNGSRSVTYSASDVLLNLQKLAFGKDVGDSELAEGDHVFVFNCQLPQNLPSSFEGSYGRVRYSVTATIDRSWRFNNYTIHPFTVISVCNLNRNPFAATPVSEQASKTFWGHSKPLSMSVDLPVRGFAPGQLIPIKVFLNNASGVRIASLYVALKQNTTFHATSKSRSAGQIVFRYEVPVPKGHERMELPINLRLPAVPSSCLEFCSIIDIGYQLCVVAKVSGWYHGNLELHTNIIVGNVPLTSCQRSISVDQIPREPVGKENQPCSPTPEYEPPPCGFLLPAEMMDKGLPPLTYERCMGPGNSGEGDGRVKKFSPLYPVYKFEDANDKA